MLPLRISQPVLHLCYNKPLLILVFLQTSQVGVTVLSPHATIFSEHDRQQVKTAREHRDGWPRAGRVWLDHAWPRCVGESSEILVSGCCTACLMCLQHLAAACNACLIMAELTEVEMICKNHLIRTRTMRINAVWFAATYPTVLIVHWVPWSVWGFHYARCWATLDLLLGKHWKAIFRDILHITEPSK